MKVSLKAEKWNTKSVEALVVPMSLKEEVPYGLPKVAEQLLNDAIKNKEFSGKLGESLSMKLPTNAGSKLRHVIVLGLGEMSKLEMKRFGRELGGAVRTLQKMKVSQMGVWMRAALLESVETPQRLCEVLAEYSVMAGYEFNVYLKKKNPQIKGLTIYLDKKALEKECKAGVKVGQMIAEKVNDSRDLANHPSNVATPTFAANFVKEFAKKETDLKVKVITEKEAKKMGMGGFVGVSQGSSEEGQFIIVEYWGADKDEKPYVIVGKGITFDTGGISLKPGAAMDEMKFDMCGAAAALGAVRAAAGLKLPINVISITPFAENMPSRDAFKPGDVLTASNGATIEVLNTDAEGRLILADALIYARNYKPAAVVDMATLTGACVVALHDSASALYTKEEDMAAMLTEAGLHNGDAVWRMPLPDEYAELLSSKIADIANIAKTRMGGSITAAKFLQFFVDGKYPWTHLDIAGRAWGSGKKHMAPGATGAGVRVVAEWLRMVAAQKDAE